MKMPGFTAATSLSRTRALYRSKRSSIAMEGGGGGEVQPQLGFGGLGGFGGFGPTLPSCHWEQRSVECGSALPGYPVPMCLEWVYVCTFPGSSRNELS